MTLPDDVIWRSFEMITDLSTEDINMARRSLENDPRKAKAKLAWEIVRIYNDKESADRAEENFNSVFSKGETPEEMEEFKLKNDMSIVEVLVESGMCSSKTDARRMVTQGAVKLDGKVLGEGGDKARPGVLQKGKRHFRRLK